jgi:hypothetical protein
VLREPNHDLLAAAQHAGRPRQLAVDRHGVSGNEAGRLGAGKLELVSEEPVDPFG